MSTEPKSYTTLYTCVACTQILSYKTPSDLDVQETVKEYTDLLQKLVKYEHKQGTKRILFETASFMERIQRYLNTLKKKELEFQEREQIFAGNPFHYQIKDHIESQENCNHFQSCVQGVSKSPLQANLQLDKFREITNEAKDYADDIILSHK
jgi:hypothetical protein